MMEYEGDLHVPSDYLVEPPSFDRPVSKFLVKNYILRYAILERLNNVKCGKVGFNAHVWG
jgi:hypothetical protein